MAVCGMRMDPPTAYIHPNSFDKVVVTKGPQTVTQGMGLVSGSVQFIRKDPDFTKNLTNINATLTAGSNDRLDGSLEAEFGGKYGYVRSNISHNEADDYKDGDGNRIHSNFKRDSQMLANWVSNPDRKHHHCRHIRAQAGPMACLRRPHDGRQQIRP